jgi:hypothetical protein
MAKKRGKGCAWYQEAKPGDYCCYDTRCPDAEKNGNCDPCGTIDGRYMEAVNDYASTCDGDCMELTHHDCLSMDPETQLGYCEKCLPKMPKDIQERVGKYYEEQTGGSS